MDEPSTGDLYHDPALAQFYDLQNGWGADFDCCMALADDAASVLDLGCGTGELAVTLARGRKVIGVDPAAAMLDVARERPGGQDVTWIQADARSARLDERFDLVLLTGHAFQVFLTRDDQRAALLTIAAHLKPEGRFVFDTRNPGFQARKDRNRDETLQRLHHPRLGPIDAWNESTYDEGAGVLTYVNSYRVQSTGQVFSASAQIRYTPQEELAAMLASAGLRVEQWLGDWQGGHYHPAAREIIPIGRLA